MRPFIMGASMRVALLALGAALAAACADNGAAAPAKTGETRQITYAETNAAQAHPASAPPPAAPAAAPKPTNPSDICAGVKVVDVAVASSSPDLRDLDVGGTGVARPSFASRSAKDYSMADLQALKARGSFDELLAHIEDVAPAARNPAWDKLLVEAATGYLAKLSTKSKSDVYSGFWTSEDLVKRYPALQKAHEFMAKRGEIGKSALAECFSGSYSGGACLDHAKGFIAVGENDRALDLAVGKIVRLNQNAYNAVPFFRPAVAGTSDDAACSDDDLKLALIAGLGLPPEYDNAKGAREIGAACYGKLKDPINQALVDDASNDYTKVNICSVLKKKGALQ